MRNQSMGFAYNEVAPRASPPGRSSQTAGVPVAYRPPQLLGEVVRVTPARCPLQHHHQQGRIDAVIAEYAARLVLQAETQGGSGKVGPDLPLDVL